VSRRLLRVRVINCQPLRGRWKYFDLWISARPTSATKNLDQVPAEREAVAAAIATVLEGAAEKTDEPAMWTMSET